MAGVEQTEALHETSDDEFHSNALCQKEDIDKDDGDEQIPPRDQWSRKIEFFLSVVGFSVGLGNVWRFPYLCYKNGGGAFLIPYMIVLVCGGVPMFFMEVALGQFMSQGGLAAWKICPIFIGIGLATTLIVFLLNIYYIIVAAWDIYYFIHVFNAVLPWSHCNNEWNTDRCRVSFLSTENNCSNTALNSSNFYNDSRKCLNETTSFNSSHQVDPVVEFWENKILEISPGVDQPDGLVWQLALSLFAAWFVCYFCVWRGVKWTGKVVYFTALFPYAMLTVLLVRGVTLDGAADGLVFYLKPDFSRLADAQPWIDAGTQIFYSYAIALGAMIGLGSYNKFTNNCYRDCIMISMINCSTSIFAGFVIFSVLGFMAKEQGVSVADVAESGPGLAFIAYPKAVTQMPLSPLWAALFFFMIFVLFLDSQFVGMEAFITVVMDLFPSLQRRFRRETFVAIYSLSSFFIGLCMVTRGGMYVFQLFDYYCASGMALLWVCFFECVAVAWIYGYERFYDNITMMIGYKINPWLRICWTFLTPALCAGIFTFMWVDFKPLTYNRSYEYPAWAQGLGMCLAFSSMLCIPVYLVVMLLVTPGSLKERWEHLATPILYPSRIPTHWKDHAELCKTSRLARQFSKTQPHWFSSIYISPRSPRHENLVLKENVAEKV